MRRPFLTLPFLLLAGFGLAAEPKVLPRRAGTEGSSALYRYGDRDVLVARGSPRAMGLAHGRLLRDAVRANLRAFLHEWALGRMGRTRAELEAIWKEIGRHVPAHYHAEMAGLAEGAGVPLADLQLLHAVPSRYHCTGAAALPAVTADGKVYHTRSLDYALDIGETVRPQTHSLLLVSVPDDGIPHAIVSWAGFLGCVTGMNHAGVAVGEMGSRSGDESYDGFPMIFLLRETLRTARTLADAKRLWKTSPRTCGYNFVFSDPRGACAIECNRTRIRFFDPGDEGGDGIQPHDGIPGIVRRCNHFVDPQLAATQRDVYDPRKSAADSWAAYRRQGDFLRARSGRIDAATMIEVLRGYPVTHPCLHQAVLCPTDRLLWVSQAADPATDPLAGAQNQPFLRYDLRRLVAGDPPAAPVSRTDRSVLVEGLETGTVRGERPIEGVFGHEPAEFRYRLVPAQQLNGVSIYRLRYPSPGPSRVEENLTVHAEYYRPAGAGPFPSAIVLHIADGRFYVARLLANTLAQRGVAALFIQLPYYGARRPAGGFDPSTLRLDDVRNAIVQAVRDVRRGAAWLRVRPELDPKRVGIAGVSLGAFVAEMAAGADGRFDRCAFVLGGGSLVETIYAGSRDTRKVEALFTARGWTREQVAATLAPLEPMRHAAGVGRDGVLMVNCRADEVVPPGSTRRYWEALGRPAIVWYDGGHYALKRHVLEVLDRIGAHFQR